MDKPNQKALDRTPISQETMNLAPVRHFWLAGAVLIAVLALLPFSFHAERHLETATRIEGSEAVKVPEELATRSALCSLDL